MTPEDTTLQDEEVIAACVDVPPPFRERACYTITTLLRPLGLAPAWVQAMEIPADRPAIYYGAGDISSAQRALRLPYAAEAAAYFDRPGSALPAFSVQPTEDGTIPVAFRDRSGATDLVASSFFWLSGWQEYVLRQRDEHGRFTYSGSVQEMYEVADVPVVDHHRRALEALLLSRGIVDRRRTWGGRSWAFCPTHDVDYVRKWRPGIVKREMLRAVRRPARVGQIVRQLRAGDPFRSSLVNMMRAVEAKGGSATWFFKAGGGDRRDVRYSLSSRRVQHFIDELLDRGFEIGLHPAYHTSTDANRLEAERDVLRKATRSELTSIRSHYLRYRIDETPRLQEQAGFRIDSTLGFPDREGFRFGTCIPFQLFDLRANRPTSVWEIPLTLMDATLFNRRGLTGEDAKHAALGLMSTCREFGGVFVGLWHNVLDDEIDYSGWREHFESSLLAAEADGAAILSLRQALEAWR